MKDEVFRCPQCLGYKFRLMYANDGMTDIVCDKCDVSIISFDMDRKTAKEIEKHYIEHELYHKK